MGSEFSRSLPCCSASLDAPAAAVPAATSRAKQNGSAFSPFVWFKISPHFSELVSLLPVCRWGTSSLLSLFREIFGCRPHMTPACVLELSQLKMDSESHLFHFILFIIFYLFNLGNIVHPVTFLRGKGEKAWQWFIHAEQILFGSLYLLRKGLN